MNDLGSFFCPGISLYCFNTLQRKTTVYHHRWNVCHDRLNPFQSMEIKTQEKDIAERQKLKSIFFMLSLLFAKMLPPDNNLER